MRIVLFLIFLAIIAWFSVSGLFEKIGDFVDKKFISKVKDTFK